RLPHGLGTAAVPHRQLAQRGGEPGRLPHLQRLRRAADPDHRHRAAPGRQPGQRPFAAAAAQPGAAQPRLGDGHQPQPGQRQAPPAQPQFVFGQRDGRTQRIPRALLRVTRQLHACRPPFPDPSPPAGTSCDLSGGRVVPGTPG
ncbi:hypothetical protein EBN88_14545, partial [Streptomyces triticirhizae]